jgi:hypothetical protein
VARLSASPAAGEIPLAVTFSSTGTYDPDGQSLAYLWDFGDGSPTSNAQSPIHTYQKVGSFEAHLTVTETSAPYASTVEHVSIRTGVSPPIAFIDTPIVGTRFRIGNKISFSGHAEAPAGVVPELSWAILQRHNLHEHLVGETSGSGGSFVPTEHTDTTTFELCLRASTGEGLVDQKCLGLAAETTPYQILSDPPGAVMTYVDDDREVITPAAIQPIIGARQTIVAPLYHAGRTFTRWSDGVLTTSRSFVVDEQPVTFNALYVNQRPILRVTRARTTARSVYHLDASASLDPEGEPLTISWRFSDRSHYKGPRISKRFKRPGRYSGTLTVKDPLGASLRKRLSFRVPPR